MSHKIYIARMIVITNRNSFTSKNKTVKAYIRNVFTYDFYTAVVYSLILIQAHINIQASRNEFRST